MSALRGQDLKLLMTGVPEVTLAREREMCYASICIVSNYASGISQNNLTIDEVFEMMGEKEVELLELIYNFIKNVDDSTDCTCLHAGENVDLHLGKGKSVYIYDWDEELSFVEKRDVEIAEDSKHQGGKVLKTCSDCDVLISVQYGFKSKIKADDQGIKLVMDEGSIDEVLKRYVDHVNFMKN